MIKKLGMVVLVAFVALLTFSLPINATATEPIGLNALLQLDRLPYLKSDTLAGGQSSYDRVGGNNDYDYYSYTDANGDKVLLDLQGPGIVYRMWFTGFIPTEGNIKIYFDGETTPRINMLIAELTAGNRPPFIAPLVGNDLASSGGYYSYVPLSFSQSIKIVTNQSALWFYYNISYHLFSSDTSLTSWSSAQDTSAAKNLWSRTGSDPKNDSGNVVALGTLNLAAGATQTILDIADPRSISSIRLQIPSITTTTSATDAMDVLNNSWIKIYWDAETSPSVSAPLGSFFAMGQFGAYPTRSLMVGMDDTNTLYIYFPMPFQNRARILLSNQRTSDTNNITYEIKHAPFNDSFANVGYFKTSYNTQTHRTDDEKDIVMLDTQGAGHLVGIVASFAGPNHNVMEGDERMYIDDSQTPVIHGTGVEDFFNGGWYFKNGTFTLPTHGNMTRLGSGQERIAAYRLFLSDAMLFRKHMRVGMEHGSRNSVTMDSWTLAYYYQQPNPRAALTDALDVGQTTSEAAHSYTISNQTWSGTQGFTYDGIMDAYGSRDDGRSHRGSSQFRLAINPSNEGVLLRRKLDYGIASQKGNVLVDGQSVGTWYTAGSNTNHRWRDDDFMIPAVFTRGKNAITIQIVHASPSIDWTEFLYLAYSITSPTPTTPIPTIAPTSTSVAPPTATRVATSTPAPLPSLTPTANPTSIVCALPSTIATIPVGASPKAIAFDPGTNRAFVALFDDSSVAVINTQTHQRIATWSTRGRGHANGLAFANNRLFVSLRDSASVAVLDATSGALIGNIPAGGMPYGMSASSNRVWVANFASGSVAVIDATTNAVIATTQVGDFPSFVIADNNRAFVSYYGGGVATIGSDGAFQNRFAPFGVGTFGMTFNAATNKLYVTNREQRQLWIIDPASGQIVKGTQLSQAPYAIAINPLTKRLFIVLGDTNQIDVRDGGTLERVALLPIGMQDDQGGDGIAITNGRVYISNNADETISVIRESCP